MEGQMETWARLKRDVAMAPVTSILLLENAFSASSKDVVHDLCFFVLQVDLLKSTSLPLMKRFGVDGEAFVVKVASTFIFSPKKRCFSSLYNIWWYLLCCLFRWWRGVWHLGVEERCSSHVLPAGPSDQSSWLTQGRSSGSEEWRIHPLAALSSSVGTSLQLYLINCICYLLLITLNMLFFFTQDGFQGFSCFRWPEIT